MDRETVSRSRVPSGVSIAIKSVQSIHTTVNRAARSSEYEGHDDRDGHNGYNGYNSYNDHNGFNGDGEPYDFNAYNATETASSWLPYLLAALVLVNTACGVLYCLNKNQRERPRRYKVVSVGSETDGDLENEQMLQ